MKLQENRFPLNQYTPYQFGVRLPKRRWPNRTITKAPQWCAVDMRDGNQALRVPMSVPQKLVMFKLLQMIGFSQIETGFPASSDIEFKMHRRLIERGILGNVTPQVLCQARPELIARTFEAMKGCPRWIFHLYNSTSKAQRELVFKKSKAEIIKIAVDGVREIRRHAATCGSEVQLQYSPESFTGTEPRFAAQICLAVVKAWNPAPGEKIIINLPATVEHTTPNVYADQIEWMINEFKKAGIRDRVIVSLHTHNDRGTGIAATELGLLAGADRVEGTLFGNGERTGNADIVTLGLNMASHGIDPKLNIFDIKTIARIYTKLTGMTIHDRHPYAGELVFTAFSGSHQDAIAKGMAFILEMLEKKVPFSWIVPYLSINPEHIGRDYKEIVRVNSQSGKGGAVAILNRDFHLSFPLKGMHGSVGKIAKRLSTKGQKEISSQELLVAVKEELANYQKPLRIREFSVLDSGSESTTHSVALFNEYTGRTSRVRSTTQQGPVDAILKVVQEATGVTFDVVDLKEEKLANGSKGSKAKAAAYIGVRRTGDTHIAYGLGVSTDSSKAVRSAVIAACNQLLVEQKREKKMGAAG
jgi:2-isopropylmalate synthase